MRHFTLVLLASFLSTATLIGGSGVGGTQPDDNDPSPDTDWSRIAPEFVRGDVDQDGGIDASDQFKILGYLFSSDNIYCLDAADTDDDGTVSVSDAAYLAAALWLGGPPPPPPIDICGPDPTEDALARCEFDACTLWASPGPGDPGELNPLWDNWLLWVYAYRDFAGLSTGIKTLTSDPAMAEAVQTNELEVLLREPDRVVLLTPESEEEALWWIVDHSRELASRTMPVHVFLQEGDSGVALLAELIEGGMFE